MKVKLLMGWFTGVEIEIWNLNTEYAGSLGKNGKLPRGSGSYKNKNKNKGND